MMSPAGDVGFSNERTALAWHRTALSLLASAAVMARLTWSDLGAYAALPLVSAALLSCWVFLVSRRRYVHRARKQRRAGVRGGLAPAALTVAFSLVALTEVAALVAV
jgi:uncharacterized membrane protein YidH (DUF202 family)